MRRCAFLLLLFSAVIGAGIHSVADDWQDYIGLADSLSTQGLTDSAVTLTALALDHVISDVGFSDSVTARILRRLGDLQYEKGDYKMAVNSWLQCLSVLDSLNRSDDLDAAYCLNELSLAYTRLGDLSEAERLLKRALEIKESSLGPEHPEIALSLHNLAGLYSDQSRFFEAKTLFERALAIRRQAYGEKHLDVASSLHDLGLLYLRQYEFESAESLLERSLDIEREILEPDDIRVANSVNTLATLHWHQADYGRAKHEFEETLDRRLQHFGTDHHDVAMSLNNLAAVCWRLGEYSEAETLYSRALKVWETVYGPEHSWFGRTLGNLARVYADQGNHHDADSLYRRTLVVFEKNFGAEHPDVAYTLDMLAGLRYQECMYAECEMLYRQALRIRKKIYGDDHRDVGTSFGSLAYVLVQQGRYAEALSLMEKARAIMERVYGSNHTEVANCLNGLGVIHWHLNRIAVAGEYFDMARQIHEEILGRLHPLVAEGLSNCALVCATLGDLDRADSLARESLSIRESALGPDHPSIASNLIALAKIRSKLGDLGEADRLHIRATGIVESLSYGDLLFARVMESQCILRRMEGKAVEARDLAERGFKTRLCNLLENGQMMSMSNMLTFSRFMRESMGLSLSCYLDLAQSDGVIPNSAADIVLSSKGLVSDMISERQREYATESDSVVVSCAKRLRSAKFRLSELSVAGPSDDQEAFQKQLDSLTRHAEGLETELLRLSDSFRQKVSNETASVSHMESLLPAGSSLIEYLRYEYSQEATDEKTDRYLAVILSYGKSSVVYDLGPASMIDLLVEEYRSQMLAVSMQGRITDGNREDFAELSSEIYRKVWQPLEEEIDESGTVFLAPDGSLNLIAFATLVDARGRFLVETHLLHYLSAGRDLSCIYEADGIGVGLLALGDPDFDNLIGEWKSESISVESPDKPIAEYTRRKVRSGCGELHDLMAERLPGTRLEISAVAKKWGNTFDEPAHVYFGIDATEARFKLEAPGKRVIHLATHGYYLEGACSYHHVPNEIASGIGSVGENPLLLSGLLLAGANLHGESADSLGTEDGILTAYEVSAMDLSGTELVVLSACESGLGKIEDGEGVYGLRRAFQVAGARTVISSLWQVSDKATAEFMGELYNRAHQSISEALREVQLKKIKKLREQNEPDHPYTWGAFIAIGDWR